MKNVQRSLRMSGAFLVATGLISLTFVGAQAIAAARGFRSAGVRIAQAAAPALTVRPDPATVATQFIPVNTGAATLWSFVVDNPSPEPVRLNQVSVYVSSTPYNANADWSGRTGASTTLYNFQLVNANSGARIAPIVAAAASGPDRLAMVTFRFASSTIAASSSLRLAVKSNVHLVRDGATPGSLHQGIVDTLEGATPITAVGLWSNRPALVSGSARGNLHWVYGSVVRLGRDATSPAGRKFPSANLPIAKFKIWRDARYERVPSIRRGAYLQFTSTVNNASPRAVRLYKDVVSAASLLGSVNIPGSMNRGVSIPIVNQEINNSLASPGTLIVTMDARDARPRNTVQAELQYLTWSDGFIPDIWRLLELPLSGNIVSF